MTNQIANAIPQKAAKVAGWAYLLIIVSSILSMIFGPYKLSVPGDVSATVTNIMANETLFRIGAAYDLLMFAGVIILAFYLYVTLKSVNKNLAFLAMLWRVAEAIIGCLMVFSSLIVLLLLNGENYTEVFETEQLQALVGLFLDVKPVSVSMLFVFIGLGTIVNCYLFYKSQYIPRILAVLGMISFSLVLIAALMTIITPNNAAAIDIAAKALATIWEVVIGLWLIVKGINVKQWEKRNLESV
ncbi:DUF4386 domain-containing protein [candidate division KSB1 bacterium]|nr:DUF4386 domain-containing protein [candidate division KSB1 bacterium]